MYTVNRRNCCSRNRRVCIYNYMYNESLCTPSIWGTVVVVIVGFVFTTTCTMNFFEYKPFDYDYNSSSYRRCTKTFIVHVVVNTNPTITATTVPHIDGVWMSLYTVYRRNCCSRNRRVCIYNNMYNECLCTPSIWGTVVAVIVGFVFTTTCTMYMLL
jgi:NADH:ubiquinone oxidoreductase subunit